MTETVLVEVKDDGWRLGDELWSWMEGLLHRPKGKPHPLGCHRRRTPDRPVMNGILFKLRTGCQWAALDATGICKHSTAHRRFQEWVGAGVFEQFWRLGLMVYDELQGIDWHWLALDGALNKAPLGGEKTGPNPTDRAKRGTKRSLLTDGQGIPIAIALDGANRNDFKMSRATLEALVLERPLPKGKQRQHLCLDKGYDYLECRMLAEEFGFTAHIRSRGEEAGELKRKAGAKARRWVVERTHSWLNRFRSILIRWEKKAENYLALLHFAMGIIAFRSSGLLG